MNKPFIPARIYGPAGENAPPKVMLAPSRYIQGPGILQNIGRYLSTVDGKRFALLASERGHQTQAGIVARSLTEYRLESIPTVFGGECSLEEINQQAELLSDALVDGLIAIGGGKCVDAGKSIAHRLDVPVVIVPTLASNDAPCSALSVLYSPQGVKTSVEAYPCSAALVVVDTAVVAQAGERFLVSGMGDAMATWYEARVCLRNPLARTALGARPSMTAGALGELCSHTLFEYGTAAARSVQTATVDDALERIVEANTLLSGVGFESGGLAAAHGFAQGFTTVPSVEENFLHGEMVAMGVLAQLMMENETVEAERVATFFAEVGLPIQLSQLGLEAGRRDALDSIVESAMTFPPIGNFSFQVTADKAREAILTADQMGVELTRRAGDEAYRRLQS